MSKLKVTTVNVVRKMEEQTLYTFFPLNSIKNLCTKEVDEHFINSTIEGNIAQEKRKMTQNCEVTKNNAQCTGCLNCLGTMFLYALDSLINICSNKWVRNVIIVFLAVCLEVFVVMVLAASTVLTTIIVNIDDAYKTYEKTKIHTEIADEDITSSKNELNENVECKRSLQDLPVKEDSDIEDALKIDGRVSTENVVIENFTTKLVKK